VVAALRASEALYASLVDAIPMCIYRVDTDGLRRVLKDTRLPAPLLELEVTEIAALCAPDSFAHDRPAPALAPAADV